MRDDGGHEVSAGGNSILILSEPLDDIRTRRVKVPESQVLVAGDCGVALSPFAPAP